MTDNSPRAGSGHEGRLRPISLRRHVAMAKQIYNLLLLVSNILIFMSGIWQIIGFVPTVSLALALGTADETAMSGGRV
jgi:hypothetical protein